MALLLILFVHLALGFLVADLVGKKRNIGFTYSILFCMFFTFIVGLLVTLCSPLKSKNVKERITAGSYVWAVICSGIALFFLKEIVAIHLEIDRLERWHDNLGSQRPSASNEQLQYFFIFLTAGFILSAIYTLDPLNRKQQIA